jgi:NTE family protein
MSNIDTLIISGGGTRCIAVIGALKYLEKNGILSSITKYAGSSAGAMISLLLNIGYTPGEIYDNVFTQDSSSIYDSFFKVPYNLLVNYGLFSGNKIVSSLNELLIKKGYNNNITFKELYEKTNKILVLTGTSLTDRDTYYFNYQTTPDMKVIDAVRISISIPLFFTSINYSFNDVSHIFVDGGLLNNFPIFYFDICEHYGKYILTCKDLLKDKMIHDKLVKSNKTNINYNENVLGIMLLDDGETRNVNNYFISKNIINNFKEYITCFIDTVLSKIETDNFVNPITGIKNNFFNRVITINISKNISAIDFNLPDDKKLFLINNGMIAANEFFNEIP